MNAFQLEMGPQFACLSAGLNFMIRIDRTNWPL
jgi:hypothetical protein